MKGWCVPVLKVLLWAFGAAVSGLCLAFGIGVLLAAPASAAAQAPAGLGGSLVSAVSGTAAQPPARRRARRPERWPQRPAA